MKQSRKYIHAVTAKTNFRRVRFCTRWLADTMNSSESIMVAMLLLVVHSAAAGERFASTIGTVQREISADRVSFTLQIKATDKTTEASNAKLERLLEDLSSEAGKLKYPATVFTVKSRSTFREWEYEDRKRVAVGYASVAHVSVKLMNLNNYSRLLTFLGTTDGFEIRSVSLSSSSEGEIRKQVIAEALKAARAKAAVLVEEGGGKLGKLIEVTEEVVETREFTDHPASANSPDPHEGEGLYPIGIYVRVRAKFEIK